MSAAVECQECGAELGVNDSGVWVDGEDDWHGEDGHLHYPSVEDWDL